MPPPQIYECCLCHKKRAFEEVEPMAKMYRCKFGCNNTPAKKPVIVMYDHEQEFILPPEQDLKDFVTDMNFWEKGIGGKLDGDVLTLSANRNNRSLSIRLSLPAILQLLASKLEIPTYRNELMKNRYMSDVEQMEMERIKFDRIVPLTDMHIKELCEAYHLIHSKQLIQTIDFLEWEKTLTLGIINDKVRAQMGEKEKEVIKLRQEYQDALKKQKTESDTIIDRMKRSIQEKTQTVEHINDLLKSSQAKYDALASEKDEQYEKFKDAKKKAEQLEMENFKLQSENEKIQSEIKKYEAGEQWAQVGNDYYNRSTKELIKFPADFTEYELKEIVNECLIYKHKQTQVEFKVPISLSEIINKQKTPNNKDDDKGNDGNDEIKGKEKIVYDALPDNEDDAITAAELSEITGIHKNNLYSLYLKKLKSKIGEIEEDGIKRFYRL